ncbi:MAG: hypothetical protein MUO76_18845, partial [Anaerolineaceae bacterium]|nr:hypothetical protein [Anaerolineaceae bacterium]
PTDLTLGQAHEQVSHLEQAVREELPQVQDLNSHIEPLAGPTAPVARLESEEKAELRTEIKAMVGEFFPRQSIHRLQILSGPEGYDVAIHMLADPDLPVTESHRLADMVEKKVQQNPRINQVIVHMEPQDDGHGIPPATSLD